MIAAAAAFLVVGGAQAAVANVQGDPLYAPASASEGMAYARMIRLSTGTVLATFEHWDGNGGVSSYVVRRSDDDGATWSTLSEVPGDTYSFQPFLYELPRQLGGHPAGTLLLFGLTVDKNSTATTIREWRSDDHGATWSYVGAPQVGGPSPRGIWEPFAMLDRAGRLLLYFSDERQSATYSQFLGHIVSADGGDSWTAAPVKDVASATQADRPGMVTVAYMPATDRYIMSFEVCGPGNCAVRVKTSADGATWNAGDLGTAVRTDDGRGLYGSPVIVWSPAGRLLLTGYGETLVGGGAPEDHQIVLSSATGDSWSWMPAPIAVPIGNGSTSNCNPNYSPDLLPSADGTTVRYAAAGITGPYGCQELTGQSNAGVLPYAADFGAGDPGWIRYGGSWSAANGVYGETTGGSGGNKAIAGSTAWTSYRVSADVRLDSVGTNGNAGLLVRATDPTVGTDNLDGYYVGVTANSIVIGRQADNWTPLSVTPIPSVPAGSWYHLAVTVDGCTITVDGTAASATDCTFTHGAVGVRDFNATASWRNLRVEPVSGSR
ncbi:family 16 glycoside hydrolase [Fodinicola acaciae]|uniref:family 16 glycoside hydrolase n=1 Tax=Fodinicola acaciae TaxID=2681555 RepID=UPI0013D7D893|nr:family 16 glycoside hydrolase [Fodinicola acaciae]